jgi:hypothetical protein
LQFPLHLVFPENLNLTGSLLIDGYDFHHHHHHNNNNNNTEIKEIAYSWRALANQEVILRIRPLAKLIEATQTKIFSY